MYVWSKEGNDRLDVLACQEKAARYKRKQLQACLYVYFGRAHIHLNVRDPGVAWIWGVCSAFPASCFRGLALD